MSDPRESVELCLIESDHEEEEGELEVTAEGRCGCSEININQEGR